MMKKMMTMLLILALILSSTAFASAAQSTGAGDIDTEPNPSVQTETETDGNDANTENTEQNPDSSAQPAVEEGEKEQVDPTTDTDTATDADTAQEETKAQPTVKKKTVSKYQKGLAAYIRSRNPKIGKKWSLTLAGYFIKSGKKHNIDPKVLMALAQRESNFRAKATSRYGYKGMMQCSASFAKAHGYKASDLYQADISIEIAAKYLRKMKNKHETYSKAIACYVCGSGAVAKGVHSREPGRSVMKVRSKIQDYLEEHHYV